MGFFLPPASKRRAEPKMAKERMQAMVRDLTNAILAAEGKKVNYAKVTSTTPAGPVP